MNEEVWNKTRPFWTELKDMSMDDMKEKMISGHKEKGFYPNISGIYKMISADDEARILDFGCGIGRNIKDFINEENWHTVGYDNPSMIEKAKEYLKRLKHKERYELLNDWDDVKDENFDVIFTVIVLQHIDEDTLKIYIKDFGKMTDKVIIHGRRNNDFGGNTWAIVIPEFEKAGFELTETTEGFTVEGDSNEHSLLIFEKGKDETEDNQSEVFTDEI